MDHINLMGSEQVERAGQMLCDGAADMLRAAQTIAEENERQRRFLDDYLLRLAGVFEDHITMLRQS
jgi:hypothetical protein